MAEQRTRKRDWFRDGVWLAGLAGIASAELVTSRVMEALEVRQEGDLPAIDALIYRLRPAELLLVLDNREHLLDACAGLTGTLLADAPLGRGGELVFAAKGRQACNQGSASCRPLTRHDSHVAQQMVERAAELVRDSHVRTRHAPQAWRGFETTFDRSNMSKANEIAGSQTGRADSSHRRNR